jgi:hypothetical protein
MAGEHSAVVRAWPAYGDFTQTLARWLAGQDVPAGIGLRTRREGTQLQLELLFDATWEERLAAQSPRALLGEGASGEARALTWERIEPGRMRASATLRPGAWYRGAVQLGGQALPFGPIGSPESAEWSMDPRRVRELEALVAATGGVERTDLASIWQAPRTGRTALDLRPLLLLAVLALFLAEALRGRLRPVPARLTSPQLSAPAEEPTPAHAPAPAPAVDADEERRRRRYGEAKRGG